MADYTKRENFKVGEVIAQVDHDWYAVLSHCLPFLDTKGIKGLFDWFFGDIYRAKQTKKFMVDKLHEHYNWNMIATTELGSATPYKNGLKDEITYSTEFLKANYPEVLPKAIGSYRTYMKERDLHTSFDWTD